MFKILSHQKTQNKTALRLPLTPARMFTIKKINNKCWLGNVNYSSAIKSIWKFLNWLKIGLAYDPNTSLLRICPKSKSTYHRDVVTCIFIAALFTVAKLWTHLTCSSTDELIKIVMHQSLDVYFGIIPRY